METLKSLWKADFATVRQLEKNGYKLFAYAGGAFVVGLVMIFSVVLAFIGIPVVIAGLVLFLVAMLWMMKLGKKPMWTLCCPYCSGKNEVFKTHPRFDCDYCGRPIQVDEYGEPIPLEAVTEQ